MSIDSKRWLVLGYGSLDLDPKEVQTSLDNPDDSYQAERDTYERIFQRLGLRYVIVSAMSGAMGGSRSEEFQGVALSLVGGVQPLVIDVEGVGVLHDELAATDQSSARARPAPAPRLPLAQGGLLVQGPARDALPDSDEVPRRGAPARRTDPWPREASSPSSSMSKE